MAGGGGSNRTAAPNLLVYALTAPLFACQVNNHINNSSLNPYAPLAGGWAGERDEVVPREACLPKSDEIALLVLRCLRSPSCWPPNSAMAAAYAASFAEIGRARSRRSPRQESILVREVRSSTANAPTCLRE